MAKGNLFLGTGANSVGDVVMYRREGSQVSRVRVRKVKNPKTDAQSLQRAAFSPVAKFYSPLAVVLERSFEGLSKARSYAKFLKTNVELARRKGWLLNKGTGFFPLPYMLSQGTLRAVTYSLDDDLNLVISLNGELASCTTIGHISQVFINNGYAAGDVVTIILIGVDDMDNYYPVSDQFIVDTASTETIATALPNIHIETPLLQRGDLAINLKGGVSVRGGAFIISRFENEKWRRSTQSLVVYDVILEDMDLPAHKAEAIASYGPNAGDPNPLVYLDGDTLKG